MKSILRLYVTTSKGNDPFLYKELMGFNLKPKFDEHLHAFYFEAPLPSLFKVAHRSLIAESMYVQIGQPFPATSETVFSQRLERIQFKNYLPVRRGLIENLVLNILVRETKYPISDNVMSSLLRNALQKEIYKRQYFQQVLKGDVQRDALPDFYQMREIVQRKWQQQDILAESNEKLLQGPSQKTTPLLGKHSLDVITSTKNSRQNKAQYTNTALQSVIPYQPHLTIYVKRNKTRLLLKVNQQEMYKLGWKKRVGWAPVRQSIATAIISQTGLLQKEGETIIWDPFCGSGTLGLLSAAMHYGAWVRMDSSNFNWQHWAIFKESYLKEYFQAQKAQRASQLGRLKLICSDISFQAANYALGNLKELASHLQDTAGIRAQNEQSRDPLVKRIRPTENWGEVMNGQWVVGCGDFQKLTENVFLGDRKVNIITNLPYLKARSADHMPLSQLQSVYRRFSKMLQTFKDKIDNVFILIDNSSSNITHPNHFLSVSSEQWVLINSFESGGLPIGLYAWSHNKIQPRHEDSSALISSLRRQAYSLTKVPDEELTTALSTYRKKVAEIQKKTYFIPRHLVKLKRGWRRVVQKRRRRHLLSAYNLFSRRRDTMIAFAQYARKKLEVRMLKRGAVWRKRNLRLLSGMPIENLQKQLKKEFEGKIQQALKIQEEKQQYRRKRAIEANQANQSLSHKAVNHKKAGKGPLRQNNKGKALKRK